MSYFYTDDARRVEIVARRLAARCGHDAIGIEHLLLALIQYGRGPVEETFFALDIDPMGAWTQWVQLFAAGTSTDPAEQSALRYTPGASHALGLSFEERRKLRHEHMGSEHLLLALLRQLDDPWAEPEPAAEFLEHLGADARRLRQELLLRVPVDTESLAPKRTRSTRPPGMPTLLHWLAGE